MKQNAILVTLAMSALALSGCTTSDDPTAGSQAVDGNEVNTESISLGSKGAIEGLVVDDNYRPVQLKEDWGNSQPGDYQDIGFVLIIETGQRYETTENGEFNIFPLEPGTYTLRVAADAHEAKDSKVNVVKGEWSEATLEARRQYSGGGTLLSQEHVLFMACSASIVAAKFAASNTAGCGLDHSGDAGRWNFQTDYSTIGGDIRGMVTEMFAHQEWRYSVAIRLVDGSVCEYSLGYCYYDSMVTPRGETGDYLISTLYPGIQWDGSEGVYREEGEPGYCKVGEDPDCQWYAFTTEYEFQTGLWTGHPTDNYVDPACDPSADARQEVNDAGGIAGCNGAGLTLGTKAQFLQNVFLYDLPEGGIADFCQLCEDAAIPE